MNDASTRTNETFTLKEKIGYTLLSVVVLGGSFFIGRNLIRNAKASSEEKKTYEEGSASDSAKRIKMAFDNDGWPGTDEEAIRTVMRAIPSKEEVKKVITSYERLYNSSLMRDLKDELQASEYYEMLAIIAGKPERGTTTAPLQLSPTQYQSWARRLKAAFDLAYGWIPATDEAAIKAVFMEIPTQAVFQLVAVAYKSEFGNDLISDLKTELEVWEYGAMMSLITKKPQA
jgi:hypothetical protein